MPCQLFSLDSCATWGEVCCSAIAIAFSLGVIAWRIPGPRCMLLGLGPSRRPAELDGASGIVNMSRPAPRSAPGGLPWPPSPCHKRRQREKREAGMEGARGAGLADLPGEPEGS